MARLVIEVVANARKAIADLGGVGGAADKISSKLSAVRAPAAAALGGIAVAGFKAVTMASDLNETVSKSQAIFGAQAGSMDAWSQGAAKAFGLSRAEALNAATGFGDMFSQLGFGGKQAADMSKSVVGLSADLGSFNNLPTADVNDRIAAAFRGEYDSLQALIPNINAARVESEAMAATGKKAAKDLTAQEKATAVLAIVQKDGAKAAGDFQRTQGGAANQTKIAQAQAADLAASLGQQLLPAYVQVLGAANTFLGFLSANQGAVTGVVAGIAALAAVLLVASAASTIYNGALAVARIASVAYTAAQWLLNAAMTANPIGIIVVAIGLLIAGLVLAWRNSETFRNVVTGAFQAVLAAAQAVWGWLKTATVAVWNFIKSYIQLQMNIVKTVFNGVKTAALFVWNSIKAGAVLVWNGIKAVVGAVVNSIKATINGYKTLVLSVWNLIKSGAVIAFNTIKNTVSSVINGAKHKFGELKAKASEVISNIKRLFSPGALINAGRQLISGLAQGIREKIGAAVDAVRRGVQRIKDLLPGSPIKDGPLKSWNNGGAGKRLMGLLASGIRAGGSQVERELDGVLASLSRPVVEPQVSLGTAGALNLGGMAAPAEIYRLDLTVQAGVGDPVEIGREVSRVLDAFAGAGGRRRAA